MTFDLSLSVCTMKHYKVIQVVDYNNINLMLFDRVGFAAEQIARWVAERTDIHVSQFNITR